MCIRDRYGTEAFGVVCDLTNQDAVNDLVEQAVTRFGEIHILANIAGCVDLESAEDIDFALVEKQMNVNAFSAFRLSQRVANVMIKRCV